VRKGINSDIKHSSAHSAYQLALRILFLEISFRCGGLSIERSQKPLIPEITPERNAPWHTETS